MRRRELSEIFVGQGVQALRREAGLPLAFGGTVTAGALRVGVLSGLSTSLLSGLGVKSGSGLGGKTVATRRLALVDGYLGVGSISHEFDYIVAEEGIHSLVSAPVVVGRQLRAVIYGGTRDGLSIRDRAVGLALDIARDIEQGILLAEAKSSSTEPQRVSTAAKSAGQRRLSARELEVLSYVALGMTNSEVADQLGLGAETVKSYLGNAMRKFDCRSRMQLVNAAHRAGLIQ